MFDRVRGCIGNTTFVFAVLSSINSKIDLKPVSVSTLAGRCIVMTMKSVSSGRDTSRLFSSADACKPNSSKMVLDLAFSW